MKNQLRSKAEYTDNNVLYVSLGYRRVLKETSLQFFTGCPPTDQFQEQLYMLFLYVFLTFKDMLLMLPEAHKEAIVNIRVYISQWSHISLKRFEGESALLQKLATRVTRTE